MLLNQDARGEGGEQQVLCGCIPETLWIHHLWEVMVPTKSDSTFHWGKCTRDMRREENGEKGLENMTSAFICCEEIYIKL